MTNERTGEHHNFTARRGVVCTHMHLPQGVPAMTRPELWNKAELAEKRKNSTVARECEVSLPHELNRETQIALMDEYASWLADRHGCAADASMHEPTSKNDEKNIHAHILMTTRRMLPDGSMGEKCRELDAAKTGSVEILAWRKHWETICNRELEAAGFDERIDCRSHKDRDMEELPTVHVGKGQYADERKATNDEIRELNGIDATIKTLLAERAELAAAAAIAEATEMAKAATAHIEPEPMPEPAPEPEIQPVAGVDLVAGLALAPAEIEALKIELAAPVPMPEPIPEPVPVQAPAPTPKTAAQLRDELQTTRAAITEKARFDAVGTQRMEAAPTVQDIAKAAKTLKTRKSEIVELEKKAKELKNNINGLHGLIGFIKKPFLKYDHGQLLEKIAIKKEALKPLAIKANAKSNEEIRAILESNSYELMALQRNEKELLAQLKAIEPQPVQKPKPVQMQRVQQVQQYQHQEQELDKYVRPRGG